MDSAEKKFYQDCDAAFEIACPPSWEIREASWGSSGAWQTLPKELGDQLSAMLERGQRRGTLEIGGKPLEVDFQQMVAVSAGRRPLNLRKVCHQPSIDKKNVRAFYGRYCSEVPPADHPAGPDGIAGEQFLQFFQDIEVDPGSDVLALAIASACKASEMGVFRRREFICGCATLEADSLDALKRKLPELRQAIQDSSRQALEEVYHYTFGVALEPPSKVLPIEEAAAYWALLLPRWPLREPFVQWAMTNMKGINRDLWNMVLKFANEVQTDLSNYDENPAWPVALDNFVEHYREQSGL
mmetsp:Transcript_63185/g.133363  ORF Transcript_63185/g.133363 Transcript_63185/m.133363 type:complete len:298 (-) Transcript_63185:124-1017(-)|eukprot:CAMPEP_0206481006 /NCGR_PEP_ID=MMETSP0324_2-20121206/37828_1 /ASSEMBLY_ACC=CAM_ASM_000836 /TAXON_ID=2866 /ORGANISM="Crypthecodinium cohnii, Strain Seligo" /LENGTH=297 /DNA_ID=CAMNT_0053958293 /DNA_START=174 /DNA_END=1067 /DNA_ORIENTATION=-